MSALRLINETNITTSVSTVNIENVFSSDFDIYKIITSGLSTAGTDQTDPNLRFIASSGDTIVSDSYDYAHTIARSGSVTDQKGSDQPQFYRAFAEGIDQEPESAGGVLYVYSPASTTYTYVTYHSECAAAGLFLMIKGGGTLQVKTALTGFQVIDGNGSRPFSSGSIRTYGLAIN